MLAVTAPAAVLRARETLLSGGVVVFPTETVYGLGVLSGNPVAEARLRALKGRDAAKPFQLLIADLAAAEQVAAVTPAARKVLAAFWPGALTVVLPRRDTPNVTIGLRAPDNVWLQSLLRGLPAGITATSANLAGCPPARTAAEADATVGSRVDLVLDGGVSAIGTASTVISLLHDTLHVLRPGSIGEADLRRVLQS